MKNTTTQSLRHTKNTLTQLSLKGKLRTKFTPRKKFVKQFRIRKLRGIKTSLYGLNTRPIRNKKHQIKYKKLCQFTSNVIKNVARKQKTKTDRSKLRTLKNTLAAQRICIRKQQKKVEILLNFWNNLTMLLNQTASERPRNKTSRHIFFLSSCGLVYYKLLINLYCWDKQIREKKHLGEKIEKMCNTMVTLLFLCIITSFAPRTLDKPEWDLLCCQIYKDLTEQNKRIENWPRQYEIFRVQHIQGVSLICLHDCYKSITQVDGVKYKKFCLNLKFGLTLEGDLKFFSHIRLNFFSSMTVRRKDPFQAAFEHFYRYFHSMNASEFGGNDEKVVICRQNLARICNYYQKDKHEWPYSLWNLGATTWLHNMELIYPNYLSEIYKVRQRRKDKMWISGVEIYHETTMAIFVPFQEYIGYICTIPKNSSNSEPLTMDIILGIVRTVCFDSIEDFVFLSMFFNNGLMAFPMKTPEWLENSDFGSFKNQKFFRCLRNMTLPPVTANRDSFMKVQRRIAAENNYYFLYAVYSAIFVYRATLNKETFKYFEALILNIKQLILCFAVTKEILLEVFPQALLLKDLSDYHLIVNDYLLSDFGDEIFKPLGFV